MGDLNGRRVRDLVTGFSGIVTGEVEYLTGCNQALVAPGLDDKGNIRAPEWLDIQRLEIVGGDPLVLPAGGPGHDREPPRKR